MNNLLCEEYDATICLREQKFSINQKKKINKFGIKYCEIKFRELLPEE